MPEKITSKKPMAGWKILLYFLIAAALLNIVIQIINPSDSKPGCNCEYEDGAGNKKFTRTLFRKDCEELIGGNWLYKEVECP